MERKLAAILVADIVGFSAQMERDEEGTFNRLTDRRQAVFGPEIARHHGRIFKQVGDGLLAEFASAVAAVECAVAVQKALAQRNQGVDAANRIDARIGINMGEVIVDGEDLFGDGVNLAARLEQLAEPGGIVVSEKVAREVERKLAFGFEPMGERKVKNITEPVSVFRVRHAGKARPLRVASGAVRQPRAVWPAALALAALACVLMAGFLLLNRPAARDGPPTLAVLPFENLSGDAAQDYLGPGIADMVITMLSTSPELRVASKMVTFSDHGTHDPVELSRILKADYLLTGSFRRQGDGFLVFTSLIDGRDGKNLRTIRQEEKGSDLVTIQEAIARRTYVALAGVGSDLQMFEEKLTWSRSNVPRGEYDFHLRGGAKYLQWTDLGKAEARAIWQEGLAKFPDSALLRLDLAAFHYNAAVEGPTQNEWLDIVTAKRLLDEAARKPDPTRMEEWLMHYLRAVLLPLATGDFEAAVAEAHEAYAMVPYDTLALTDLAWVMAKAGEGETAVKWAEEAIAIEPLPPPWYYDRLAWAYYAADRPQDAVDAWDRTPNYMCLLCKAGAMARAGDLVTARAIVSSLKADHPDLTLNAARWAPGGRQPVMVDRLLARYLDDLRAAGLD